MHVAASSWRPRSKRRGGTIERMAGIWRSRGIPESLGVGHQAGACAQRGVTRLARAPNDVAVATAGVGSYLREAADNLCVDRYCAGVIWAAARNRREKALWSAYPQAADTSVMDIDVPSSSWHALSMRFFISS